jgi:AcrR family transcriptional regulator
MPEDSLSKGERTHRAIIESAYTLFLEQGYTATSMRQIAGRTGLALGSIYNHFDSKEAIFSDLIISKHPFHQVLPLLLTATGDTVEEFVRNAARSMVGELGRRPDFVKFMFVELVEFNGRDVPKMIKIIYPQVAPIIERFQASRGELRSIPPYILFRAFVGLFFSFYLTEYLLTGTPDPAMQEDALDHFVEIFLFGVLATKETA